MLVISLKHFATVILSSFLPVLIWHMQPSTARPAVASGTPAAINSQTLFAVVSRSPRRAYSSRESRQSASLACPRRVFGAQQALGIDGNFNPIHPLKLDVIARFQRVWCAKMWSTFDVELNFRMFFGPSEPPYREAIGSDGPSVVDLQAYCCWSTLTLELWLGFVWP